jgi:uncharacterized protein
MLTRRQFTVAMAAATKRPISAVIIDGRHNHDWRETTPQLRQILVEANFSVDVATAPPDPSGLAAFRPSLAAYDVVVLNYTDFGNGGLWSPALESDFVEFVSRGGGVVIVHAASSAFPHWSQFNEIIGLGGWGGRDETSGPFLYFRDGVIIRDPSPRKGGHHGRQHAFVVTARTPEHPIMRGLPTKWRHGVDELFDTLRGPAKRLEVLATAWSDPATGGSGRHEPALFTVRYQEGRTYHTVLGHSVSAMRSPGFAATLQRGTEWAATGRVTQPSRTDIEAVA